MTALIIAAVLFGGTLGQFFKVLILVPAGGLSILLTLSVSIFLGDPPHLTALKIIAIISSIPVGYALGQTVFYVPGILQAMRRPRTLWTTGHTHAINKYEAGHVPEQRIDQVHPLPAQADGSSFRAAP
jgi:membrane protein DedA with SNARE-associated domain